MALSSLELLIACQQQGLLSKEAAAAVVRVRQRMIKEAMSKYAINLFKLRKVPSTVESAKATKAGGFFSKLRTGGVTGAKESAGWSDVTANLAKMMTLAGMTAGATAGLGALMHHSQDKRLDAEVQNSYKTIMQENPNLARPEVRDDVRKYFGVIARFAPSIAAEPAAAAPIVTMMATQGAVEMATIKTLAETQARIDDFAEKRKVIRVQPLRAGEFAARAMLAQG